MPRRSVILPLLAILLLPMAGCLSSSPINWGSDVGQYSAVLNENNTEIVIDDRMSVYQESYLESVGIGTVGCQGENGTMAQSSQSVVADEYGGKCNLRFDDTNPLKEEAEYVKSIIEDVKWLGYKWSGDPLFDSDYFDVY